jgi:hypothetical protein
MLPPKPVRALLSSARAKSKMTLEQAKISMSARDLSSSPEFHKAAEHDEHAVCTVLDALPVGAA